MILLYFMSMHCNCYTIALFSHLGYYFIKHTYLLTKAWYLTMRNSALQPWKGQLTGIGYSTAAQASGAQCPRNGLWTRSYAAQTYYAPVSHSIGLQPVIRVPNYMDHHSFPDP